MSYQAEFLLAEKVVLEAGKYLLSVKEKRVESSVGHDIKLELDRKAEDLILNLLKTSSSYPIYAEESGMSKELLGKQPYWIVDPIDGSLNFLHDIPFYCISVALWVDNIPIIGVVYDFKNDDILSSLKGKGAFFNGIRLSSPERVNKSQGILATGFPTYLKHDSSTLSRVIENIQSYKKVRLFGSAALSISYVCLGRVHAYYEDSIKLWDVAAGIAISHELGLDVSADCIDEGQALYRVFISSLKKQ